MTPAVQPHLSSFASRLYSISSAGSACVFASAYASHVIDMPAFSTRSEELR